MDVPALFSRDRRWCWAERATFSVIWVVAIVAGFGLAWWGLAVFAVATAGGITADLVRHRRQPGPT